MQFILEVEIHETAGINAEKDDTQVEAGEIVKI